jgi:hypothetical protein
LLVAALVFFLLSALFLPRLIALLASLARALFVGLGTMLLTGLPLSTLLTCLILLTVFLHIVCHEVFLPRVRFAAHRTI